MRAGARMCVQEDELMLSPIHRSILPSFANPN